MREGRRETKSEREKRGRGSEGKRYSRKREGGRERLRERQRERER